jgi:integrase
MAKAKRLPSGNYRVQIFVGFKKDEAGNFLRNKNGKKIPDYESITHPDRAEAEYLAAEFKRERESSAIADMTVRQAMERYVKNRNKLLSPTTQQGYRKIIRNNLQSLMDIKIRKLTQDDIQAAVNADALALSSKTLHNAHGFLSSVLNAYRPRMKLTTTMPPKKKKFKELPSVHKVFAAVKDKEIELAALLAMWLSFSMSEIRGIMKSDIKDGVLTLSRVIVDVDNRPVVKDVMKEYERSRRHEIPLYIMNMIDKCEGLYIVPLNAHQIDYWWYKARDEAKLPPITFHDLRHVNASVMHLLGIPDKYAMERGGWKTDGTMKAVYQNVFTDERKEVDRKINDYFEQIVNSV